MITGQKIGHRKNPNEEADFYAIPLHGKGWQGWLLYTSMASPAAFLETPSVEDAVATVAVNGFVAAQHFHSGVVRDNHCLLYTSRCV